METKAMNKLVNKIFTIKRHLEMHEQDPLLIESYHEYYDQLKQKHGHYLKELMFDIYDEYCSDNEMQDLSDYLSPKGVEVEADDFPGIHSKLFIKPEPLRIVISDVQFSYEEVLWKAS